ncbi:hypothetical protein [Nostoc sp. JL23]|uniref:hypothetical protein n=1 Tax=Nostoc sp. JL23 TaxID=2815394 RepID=UPI001DD9F26C|nr:hypothetical protein [Nostoc sp. JL23]MBN3875234.1 hypothetical protein [Nostoc sp. JL23]
MFYNWITSYPIKSSIPNKAIAALEERIFQPLRLVTAHPKQGYCDGGDRILQLANTPRSLTVQTPNPVDDAAKLMSDMSRGQLVSSGL